MLHCFYEAQDPSLCNLVNFRKITLNYLLNPVDYLAIGYYITSLLSVPSSDASNVQFKIAGEIDDHRLRLLLLELSKYQIISACAARLEMEFSELQSSIVKSAGLVASFLEQSSAVSKLTIESEMSTDAFFSLAKALQSNSHLTTLNISILESEYESTSKENDGEVIKNMFKINKSLMHFSLRPSGFASVYIIQGMQHNKILSHLKLCGRGDPYASQDLSDIGFVAKQDIAQGLTTMLQVNKTLTHLDLSNNSSLSDQGACCIFQGLLQNDTLVYLNLSDMGLTMTEDTAQALTTMLQVNKTLTHLDLSDNNFIPFGSRIWFIFERLQCNTTLVQLNLSNTELIAAEVTAQVLTTMLQVNKTLTHLDLSNNWDFPNASCVFQGLQNNTTLVYLNLGNIKLEVKKDTPLAKALTTMLQENKHLKHLDLAYNYSLCDEGVYCLCEGLQHNTTLVHLNLCGTGITDKGAECIAQAYNSNRSLQLNLANNHLRDYKTLYYSSM